MIYNIEIKWGDLCGKIKLNRWNDEFTMTSLCTAWMMLFTVHVVHGTLLIDFHMIRHVNSLSNTIPANDQMYLDSKHNDFE